MRYGRGPFIILVIANLAGVPCFIAVAAGMLAGNYLYLIFVGADGRLGEHNLGGVAKTDLNFLDVISYFFPKLLIVPHYTQGVNTVFFGECAL